MPATISVSSSVDSALRRAFSEASVRLQPDALMSSIIAALEGLGIEISIQDDVLVMQQGATQMNTSLALRNFAKRPEYAQFFVLEGNHPTQWSREKKIEFLKTHSDEEFRAMLQAPVLEQGIKCLDPNMSRQSYEQLTRSERMQFIKEYGSDAVGRIYQKTK